MASINQVILMGTLTLDPETRRFESGGVKTSMVLETVQPSPEGSSGKVRQCFVAVEAWDRQAEACDRYLKKGSLILVEGRLQMERDESNPEAPRTRLFVKAFRVQFLESASQAPRYVGPVTTGAEQRGQGRKSDNAEDRLDDEEPFHSGMANPRGADWDDPPGSDAKPPRRAAGRRADMGSESKEAADGMAPEAPLPPEPF